MADPRKVVTVRRRTIVDGVRLHYRVAGRGRGGVPAVCLAAPGESSGSVDPLLEAIGSTRLAFALDLPGHGRSGNPPYGRRDPARWLLAWLAQLGFEHCHLVVVDGSLGVATDAVRRSRRAIESVALLAPPPLERPGYPQRVGTSLGGVRVLRDPRAISRAASRLRSQSAGSFRQAMHPRDLNAELAALALPLLVLRGERDALVSHEDAGALARRGRGTFIDMPAATRHSWRTNPQPFASALGRWWDSIDRDGVADAASHRSEAGEGRG